MGRGGAADRRGAGAVAVSLQEASHLCLGLDQLIERHPDQRGPPAATRRRRDREMQRHGQVMPEVVRPAHQLLLKRC